MQRDALHDKSWIAVSSPDCLALVTVSVALAIYFKIGTAPDPADRRGRLMRLTAKGRTLLIRAVPAWRNTRAKVEALLPDGNADRLRNNLRVLS